MVVLKPTEARVLGALMEKELTTPEYYPLSLNALVNACNQKSSRDPVMELTEADVRTALFDLEQLALARRVADGRVSKFEHRTRDGLNLRRDEFAVICLLLLRGPQTAAELRTRSERLFTFDDHAAAVATLERLAQRPEPLTILLPRQPGAREARWAHLLAGPINIEAIAATPLAATKAASPGAAYAAQSSSASEEILQRLDLLEEAAQAAEERLRALEEKLFALEGFMAPHQ